MTLAPLSALPADDGASVAAIKAWALENAKPPRDRDAQPVGKGPKYKSLPKTDRRHVDRLIRNVVVPRERKILQDLGAARVPNYGSDKTAYRGEPWRETVRASARTLVKTYRASWNGFTPDKAKAEFVAAAPTDEHWTDADNLREWNETVDWASSEGVSRAVPDDLPSLFDPDRGRKKSKKSKAQSRPTGDPELEAALAALDKKAFAHYETLLARERAQDYLAERKHLAANVGTFESRLVGWDGLLAMPPVEYLVEGVLDRGALALFWSISGLGKSTLMLGMCLSIACGVPWLGHNVRQGRVLYVAGEGVAGLGAMARAWKGSSKATMPAGGFALYPLALDHSNLPAILEAARSIAKDERCLIVIDTLNNSAGGLEENGATQMSQMLNAGRKLTEAVPGATIVYVHHAGKDGTLRGSTALYASSDIVLKLSGAGGVGGALKLEFDKRKFGPSGPIGNYKLVESLDSVIIEGISPLGQVEVDPQALTREAEAWQVFKNFGRIIVTQAEWRAALKEKGFPISSRNTAIKDLREKRKAVIFDQDKKSYVRNPDYVDTFGAY